MTAKAPRARKGQATTETALLLPMFFFFLFAFAKIFAMLILVQKLEIASFYAARRWQLESHRNIAYESFDDVTLKGDIETKVLDYVGRPYTPMGKFLDISNSCTGGKKVGIAVSRTQVWNIVTLTICTRPIDVSWMYHSPGFTFEVTKYVPNRDRPIQFVLPGVAG